MDKETVFYDSKPRVRVDEPQDLSSSNSPPVHHGPCSQVRARCGQNSVQLPLLMHIAALCTLRTHQQLHMAVGIISVLCPAWSERNLNPVPKNGTYVVICMQVVFIGGGQAQEFIIWVEQVSLWSKLNFVGFFEVLVRNFVIKVAVSLYHSGNFMLTSFTSCTGSTLLKHRNALSPTNMNL